MLRSFFTVLLLPSLLLAVDPPQKFVLHPTSPDSPRNGEGDVAVLSDGRLFLAYSHWTKKSGHDDAPCEIVSRTSANNGLTWSAPTTLIPNDAMNLMSVSLLRLHPRLAPATTTPSTQKFSRPVLGALLMVYGRRRSDSDMRFYARTSTDDAKTWSPDTLVTALPGYQVVNNARVIQLSTGRLLAPTAICRGHSWKRDMYFYSMLYYSDDDGQTWRPTAQRLSHPASTCGTEEPGVIELKDGRVLMLMRGTGGHPFRSTSSDQGLTWTDPEPMPDLSSPVSPSTIRRVPTTGDLLLLWNNATPDPHNNGEPRSPLTCALSSDEGQTWRHIRNLETTPHADYCYTSCTFLPNNRAVLTYYERAGLKLALVDLPWLYADK